MSNTNENNLGQAFADSLNWGVLREYYETNKHTDKFKRMSPTELEQWFYEGANKARKEQGLSLRTIEEIRELLKLPYSPSN